MFSNGQTCASSVLGTAGAITLSSRRLHISLEHGVVDDLRGFNVPGTMSTAFTCTVAFINAGDVQSLRSSLDSKLVSPDEKDENGQTLLMIAAQCGQLPIVEELIRQGCDIHLEDLDNWTALLNAAKEGYTDIVAELVMHKADIEHRDMGGWTALMWASYKGHGETVKFLLEQGAFPNVHDLNHMSCLIWAAGRGYEDIAADLLSYGAKVNSSDKYGTSPLVWAARKGYKGICEMLLDAGANVDTAGMYSWTPLIVAAKGDYADIVSMLLEYKPNVNAVDADGYTALAIACKEGYTDIAVSLLNAGAYVNMQDRSGDTNLIHAAKAGNFSIVDVLLKKYADVDIQGTDRKTALYWAVEKGYVDIVRLILSANPNIELATKDGDTALMKATRNRITEIVQALVDKKAKVSAADKRGDTALHIAMRARSKGIVEILLRNPKNSRLLYRPNKSNETPYNIDTSHQKSILAQIFGARRLNTNEDSENMLGYDLYSSALADILSEPSLSMPISVGLYARWGSGKSFLLGKLEEDMRSFAVQWIEQTFSFSWVLFCLVTFCSCMLGYIFFMVSTNWLVGLPLGVGAFMFTYCTLYVIRYGSVHHDWNWAYKFCVHLEGMLGNLKTLLQVAFCHPPSIAKDFGCTVRFVFTHQNKVSSSGAGDASIAFVIMALHTALEDEFGFFTTRFYRAFQPKPVGSSSWTWRRMCCLPCFVVFLVTLVCLLAAISLATLTNALESPKSGKENPLQPVLITLTSVVGVALLTNVYTWVKVALALFMSNHRRIRGTLMHVEASPGGYLEALKGEVELISGMVHCLDAFVRKQTRLVLIVDGLDSCEQDKVLKVLDAVYVLFSDPGQPFVTILALDPHIIIKAIEANLHRAFHNTTNSGLRKVRAAQQAAVGLKRSGSHWCEEKEVEKTQAFIPPQDRLPPGNRRVSSSSMSIPESFRKPQQRKGNQKLKASDSVASSMSNLHRGVTGAQDLTKVLLTDDYFSDINPRSMRRLMNIVYVTGRLLKAFNIDFNWYHLASWVNITEQWPFHTSWIILHYETHENDIEDTASLKSIFEKIKNKIPMSKELQALYDVDHDVRKFEVFLSFHSSSLLISDLKIFVPFTINLDPYIRRAIQEKHQAQLEAEKSAQKVGSGTFGPPTPAPMTAILPTSPWTPLKPEVLYPPAPSTPVPPPAVMDAFQQSYQPVWWSPGTVSAMPVPAMVPKVKVWNEPFTDQLHTLSVDGVQRLLAGLEGIDKAQVPAYQKTLAQHNIHGQVLLTCNITELRSVLNMSFGDWELFKMAVLALREQEYQHMQNSAPCSAQAPNDEPPVPFTRDRGHSFSSSISCEYLETKPKEKNVVVDSTDKGMEKSAVHSQASTRRGNTCNTSIEKQVTMEESLIVGALETLSEEAMEDTIEESMVPHPGFPHSQALSPILSDPGEQEDGTGGGSGHKREPEVDFVYLKMLHGSPGHKYSFAPLSASVPEHEWGVQGSIPPVYYGSELMPDPYLNSNFAAGVSAPPSIASSPNAPPAHSFATIDSTNLRSRTKQNETVVTHNQPEKDATKEAKTSGLLDHWKGSHKKSEAVAERHGLDSLNPANERSVDESTPLIERPRVLPQASMSVHSRDAEDLSRREREFIHPIKPREGKRSNFERQFSVDERSDTELEPLATRAGSDEKLSSSSMGSLHGEKAARVDVTQTPHTTAKVVLPQEGPSPNVEQTPEAEVAGPSRSSSFKLPPLISRTFLQKSTQNKGEKKRPEFTKAHTYEGPTESSTDAIAIEGKRKEKTDHAYSSTETII
ncbi:kinase D-interacting substrate of 220 kDa B-like isoform X2 [Ornithodoros turicata]|uniref:kinase D-interacting substrate of 220 kDa B-like isoform X2 n=1 Tax=Ornithodoros turicata TaxID=34597 RepID=UPI003139BECF